MKKMLVLVAIVACLSACKTVEPQPTGPEPPKLGRDGFVAWFVETPPVIDGVGNDAAWEKAAWQDIKYEWMYGDTPQTAAMSKVKGTNDFSGRFKVVWTADRLYILAEIIDDIISATRLATPYTNPENDDCLELFIDENASGGGRSESSARSANGENNFFVYHISFGGTNVADYVGGAANDSADITQRIQNGSILRNSHLKYVIGKNDATHTYTWEIAMKVYDDTYPLRSTPDIKPVTLTAGKIIGFAAAYCDADAKNTREHFIGSMFVTGDNDHERNVSYRDSTQYAKMYLDK